MLEMQRQQLEISREMIQVNREQRARQGPSWNGGKPVTSRFWKPAERRSASSSRSMRR